MHYLGDGDLFICLYLSYLQKHSKVSWQVCLFLVTNCPSFRSSRMSLSFLHRGFWLQKSVSSVIFFSICNTIVQFNQPIHLLMDLFYWPRNCFCVIWQGNNNQFYYVISLPWPDEKHCATATSVCWIFSIDREISVLYDKAITINFKVHFNESSNNDVLQQLYL